MRVMEDRNEIDEVETRLDYSQFGEQEHILAIFKGKIGRFLDIGAWDGRTFSNTFELAVRGWSGLLVEPSPECFLKLLDTHGQNPKMMLLNCAIGFERSMVKLWSTPDAVSTTVASHYEFWRQHAAYTGSFFVPQITFEELFNQFAGFDFISIDTEGTSPDLFLRLLRLNHRPPCLCVEHDGRCVELAEAAQRAGYRVVHMNGTNLIFAT